MPAHPTRRQTLKGLSAFAGAAAIGCKPDTAPTPLDTDAAPDVGPAIQTWVVLMMENRSFDHYFGALSLEEGRTDVDGLRPEHVNVDKDGVSVHPFHLTWDCLEDPPHGWSSSRAQFAEGANSGFVEAHAGGRGDTSHEVMGYYNRADLPIFYALADGHALCQRWFSAVMSSTWPNRFYALTGTSLGGTNNDFSQVPFAAKSLFRQLDEAGVSWKIYATDVPFGALLADVGGLIDDGRVVSIDAFYEEAAAGTLPTVCIVDPGFSYNDDHPPHATALGQIFVGTVYHALATSPHWGSCCLVVDYDEHGGFYDHVPPPLADDDYAAEGFDQLGFRVPGLVVGPYNPPGVISDVYDHTSVLKTLQEALGMEPLSARNAAANPLWGCFDADRMERRDPLPPVTLPVMEVDEEGLRQACGLYALPGQPELEHLADTGFIRPAWDFRGRIDLTMARMLKRAEQAGFLRVRRRP